MSKNHMPQMPGYYWAKWRIASDATNKDLAETLPSHDWEIVEVNANVVNWEEYTDLTNSERLSVAVTGVAEVQWRDCFIWGDFVAPLKPTNGVHSGVAFAWASSKPYRKNRLMSAAQWGSASIRNRADFDIPLFAHADMELLAALKLAREYMSLSLGSTYEGENPYPIIDAAIAKAEGREVAGETL